MRASTAPAPPSAPEQPTARLDLVVAFVVGVALNFDGDGDVNRAGRDDQLSRTDDGGGGKADVPLPREDLIAERATIAQRREVIGDLAHIGVV